MRISDTTVQKYSELIEHACSTLKLSPQDVKAKYSDYPICLMEYIEKGVHQDVIEIRFDSSNTTMSIYFDKNNVCNTSYLFLDDIEDATSYVLHLNDLYDYDFVKSSWILSDCYISIQKTKDDICLKLFQQES